MSDTLMYMFIFMYIIMNKKKKHKTSVADPDPFLPDQIWVTKKDRIRRILFRILLRYAYLILTKKYIFMPIFTCLKTSSDTQN